jgi:deazaflavin-dependent oxidoreductase (nitroreductase family)
MMPPLEKAWSRLSGGRFPLSGVVVPSLVLHTIGAKSGLERDTPLMYCPEPGGTMLVTGSNFARDAHPAWTANLIAHPRASVTVHRRRMAVLATRIPDDRLDETWDWIERQWPGYRGYERSSGRTLRIFRLTPTA